ncbi:xanthine dehydrogenase small subunit [Pseudopelagicola sp. nBUS_20]|uniref:xanthine dehydrogenase small subunit n=1 Tax=Pseudopelagicola sp. nBUS_20 TaxID=3395317 RepID=UPI003EB8E45D
MQIRNEIRFVLNGQDIVLANLSADETLLDYLRLDKRLIGTKEGCAEGDCGACTVLVGRLKNDVLTYKAVNACILFLASLDGSSIVTIEYLQGVDGRLNPVQTAMVAHHGSQCGFCTPGFVMSLYALWMENASPTVQQIETAIQGNLCRCTGYAPIIRAALAMSDYGTPSAEHLTKERDSVSARLKNLRDQSRVVVQKNGSRAILPINVDDLASVLVQEFGATIVAGGTDVGLWVTKFLRHISPAVFVGHLEDFKQVAITQELVSLGAGITYTEAQEVISKYYPHLSEFWDRIAGWQVRNMGTLGGNIANGSPIGDLPPVLIALGAIVTLRKGELRRELRLEDYFISYRKQDRGEGEFIESISIPRISDGYHAAYKISKRRDEDISSVAVGFNIQVTDGLIASASVAFGGMAATPKRAAAAEATLIGQSWGEAAFEAAARQLPADFAPLTDVRATSDYRMKVAQNLFRRFWLEKSGLDVRLIRLQRG